MINLRGQIETVLDELEKRYLDKAKEFKANRDPSLENVCTSKADSVFLSKVRVFDVLDEAFNSLSVEQKKLLQKAGISLKNKNAPNDTAATVTNNRALQNTST